ncbi:MAG: AAA-type ATPase lid domain-containing protein, partial [Pyrinomonadaceae bacterium]
KVNVRALASSNRDVEAEVKAGRFREDLFYRLNGVSIRLPALRERREDIPPLAQTFAARVYSLSPTVRFSAGALEQLERYPWPGNIRELENAVVRAAAMCDGVIRVQDLPDRIRNHKTKHEIGVDRVADLPSVLLPLSDIEGQHVAKVLAHTGGNKQAASRILAVDRKTLDRMIKRHGIDFNRRTRPNGAGGSE